MRRKDYLQNPVKHIKINGTLTVDQLIQQFQGSGSFGAGRLARACNIYEKMLRDKDCTVFLALSSRANSGHIVVLGRLEPSYPRMPLRPRRA